MTEDAVAALLRKLEANPGNALLRVAVARRLAALGAESQALSVAFDLAPAAVAAGADRAFLAELFAAAGLDDDAAAWREGAAPAAEAPEPPAPAPEPPEPEPEPEPEPAPPPRATAPSGRPTLRVVGGADEDAAAPPPEPESAPITFADVGGLEAVKRDIERRIVLPFKEAGLLARFRKRSGGGVLLYGPPGCGKTLLARATAGECGAAFQPVSIPDVLDPLYGVSERRLAGFFETARSRAPSVLFFDEIDALASKRTAATATHSAQLVSAFLAEMDGVGKANDGVLVLAATNAPWTMDGAFLRPGRFDRMFFAPPPDRAAREAILALELGARPQAESVRLDRIAQATSGLSGADLADLVERAADRAIDATLAAGGERPIDQTMLEAAAREVRSSVADWLTTARNYALYSNEGGRYDDILAFLQQHGGA